jgi:hypothetical protein
MIVATKPEIIAIARVESPAPCRIRAMTAPIAAATMITIMRLADTEPGDFSAMISSPKAAFVGYFGI